MFKFKIQNQAKQIKEFKKKFSLDLLKKINLRYKTIEPNFNKLYFLYKVITENKRLTVLEFGSGWSTFIISLGLFKNYTTHNIQTKKLRKSNNFTLFSIDNSKKYLSLTKKKFKDAEKKMNFSGKFKKIKVNWIFSSVSMTMYNGNIATQYNKLPVCNPDFIYLDGPDQYNIKKKINGFNTAHKELMPMSCDILMIENFLMPGTIIVVDGRGANAEFLRKNFKRKWKSFYSKYFDQHLFYLDEKSFGKWSSRLLKFYKS